MPRPVSIAPWNTTQEVGNGELAESSEPKATTPCASLIYVCPWVVVEDEYDAAPLRASVRVGKQAGGSAVTVRGRDGRRGQPDGRRQAEEPARTVPGACRAQMRTTVVVVFFLIFLPVTSLRKESMPRAERGCAPNPSVVVLALTRRFSTFRSLSPGGCRGRVQCDVRGGGSNLPRVHR